MEKGLLWMLLLTIITGGCAVYNSKRKPDLQKRFPDVLNIRGIPQNEEDESHYCFSDLGAWHGFGLPDSANYYGGFTGPFIIANNTWVSKCLAQLSFENADGTGFDFSSCNKPLLNFYPGLLNQSFKQNGISVSMSLFFISGRTAVVRIEIVNQSGKDARLYKKWAGRSLVKKSKLVNDGNEINLVFEGNDFFACIDFNEKVETSISADGLSYTSRSVQPLVIRSGTSCNFSFFQSFYFNQGELQAETSVKENDPSGSDTYLDNNKKRWNAYLENLEINKTPYPHLAVKALITLITNWRSPAGALVHEGLFPSYHYIDFHGFWAWDSWKQVVALSRFAPELAENQIRAMFDYQDASGMVADCVFRDTLQEAVNRRDTKPPLASWAVLEVFEQTGDTGFVKEMLPKLLKYHAWWYANRDHDQNGLCEYGSTDGTRIAAAWESGMDNAVRFDHAVMVQNNPSAWSLNQESVDLNCYLYAEKKQLATLLSISGDTVKAREFANRADELCSVIRKMFYDEQSGFFYDIDLDTKKAITVQGPEGWIALWTRVATPEQARKIAEVIMDTAKFNTFMPFPTLARNHPKFNPEDGYWRGPVWLDQAYFAIEGMRKYGYSKEADLLCTKLIENAEGLASGSAPIRENYHPTTGKGLNAYHFSWSAAHYLLLIKDMQRAK